MEVGVSDDKEIFVATFEPRLDENDGNV